MTREHMMPPKASLASLSKALQPDRGDATGVASQPAAQPNGQPKPAGQPQPASGASAADSTEGTPLEQSELAALSAALGAPTGPDGQPLMPGMPGSPGAPGSPGGPGGPGAPGDPGAQGGQGPGSLFKPLEAGFFQGREEMDYVNEVDAALARKPSKGVYLLSTAVGAFFIILLLWAAFAWVDEVTRAEGQVVPSQRTQSIQNLEGGILQEVLVREGQVVEKNTPLARLENVLAGSSYRDAYNRMLDHKAAIIRLTAELNNAEPVFGDDFAKEFEEGAKDLREADVREKSRQIIEDHMGTYQARRQQREAELELLKSQFEQRQKDVEEQLSRKNQLERSLKIAVEQRDIAFSLMQRRNLSRTEYLNLEQKVVSLQGDIETLAASLPKAQAAAREAEQRISFRQAELNTAVNEEINKRRTELASLRETLSAGGDRVARTELRSPVRGTVKQIYLNSLGGVVKPGESIMDIVPLDETLLVEARVRPADVAFLHPGQKAVVKISAYDFSIYGGLEGKLEQISADTIEDKKGEFHYLVKVRTNTTALKYRQQELPIIPGMMASVDILTGKKTILDYVLKPILKAKQNALRER